MPPVKMPKTLDIPPIEDIQDLESLKEWLRYFTELFLMVYEHSQSDVAYQGEGNIGDLGVWRLEEVGETLEIQKKISGTWTRIGVWSE